MIPRMSSYPDGTCEVEVALSPGSEIFQAVGIASSAFPGFRMSCHIKVFIVLSSQIPTPCAHIVQQLFST